MQAVRTQPVVVSVHDASSAATLRLQARFAAGERGAAVVAPPHPLYGGTIDNPVVAACVRGLHHAGLATLAFNFRGVEGSEGQATEQLGAAVDDYHAALEHLTSQARGPYLAAGYSFGAGAALLAAGSDARVAGVVLLAPPVGMLRTEDLAAFAGPVLVVVGDDDEYAPLGQLQPLLAARPDCALELIKDTDHFFHFGGGSEIDKLVATHVGAWLARF